MGPLSPLSLWLCVSECVVLDLKFSHRVVVVVVVVVVVCVCVCVFFFVFFVLGGVFNV